MRPIYLLMNICSNYWKRKAEYATDQETVSNGFGEDMISVMKKSCREEYKPINTNPYYILLYCTHPTVNQRISAIRRSLNKKINLNDFDEIVNYKGKRITS